MNDENLREQCQAYRGVLDDIRKMTGGKRGSAIGAMADAVLRQNGDPVVRTIEQIRGADLAKACANFVRGYLGSGVRRHHVAHLETALDNFAALTAANALKDTSKKEQP